MTVSRDQSRAVKHISRAKEQEITEIASALAELQAAAVPLELRRNKPVGELVDAGYSTYAIAALAGITQPRVVHLNNREKGGTTTRSIAPRGAANQPREAANTE